MDELTDDQVDDLLHQAESRLANDPLPSTVSSKVKAKDDFSTTTTQSVEPKEKLTVRRPQSAGATTQPKVVNVPFLHHIEPYVTSCTMVMRRSRFAAK